jgi:flavin-dependent dehydrogenase
MATRVEQVLFEDSRAMGVRVLRDNGDPREIPARVVADCSGRATRIGSQLGLRGPVPGLKKSSLWGYYRGGKRLDGIDAGETTIFMLPQGGWFWYIPLPEDTVSVGIVADPEYVFGDDKDLNAAFVSRVAQCPPLSARLSEAHLIGPVRGLRNLAYRNRKIVGDGWLMVGDAAAFLDPIYSSGLFLALASAELAANCVHEALASGNLSQAKLGEFAAPLSEGIEVIRRLIHAFYDPNFNFQKFVARYPGQRTALIDCLVGDVINKDMDSFLDALASMTDPPEPLNTIN